MWLYLENWSYLLHHQWTHKILNTMQDKKKSVTLLPIGADKFVFNLHTPPPSFFGRTPTGFHLRLNIGGFPSLTLTNFYCTNIVIVLGRKDSKDQTHGPPSSTSWGIKFPGFRFSRCWFNFLLVWRLLRNSPFHRFQNMLENIQTRSHPVLYMFISSPKSGKGSKQVFWVNSITGLMII